MGLLRDAAFAAAGYGLHELVNNKKKEKFVPEKSLADIIDEYAQAHNIWGRDERFYQQLLNIISKYHDPYENL